MNTTSSNKACEKWDYRVMVTSDSGDMNFEIHKMCYDEQGREKMYNTTPASVKDSSAVEVASFIQIVKSASQKPILWKGRRFPEIYSIKETSAKG